MDNVLPGVPAVHMSFGAAFFFSVFFGLVGTIYFMYGKREQKYVCMFAGIGLGVFPYFVSSVLAVVLVGILLMAVPFVIKD